VMRCPYVAVSIWHDNGALREADADKRIKATFGGGATGEGVWTPSPRNRKRGERWERRGTKKGLVF
jgi:hypothetical protein